MAAVIMSAVINECTQGEIISAIFNFVIHLYR